MFLHLSVSHYVQRGVCPVHAGVHPLGRHPQAPLGQTPRTATAVDGTHPTGMLSCYHPQRSCGKVIFSQVCVKNSDHGGGGVYLSACWDTHTPPAQSMLGYTQPLPSACLDTSPFPVHAGIDMATAADGTHPTGMHSCYRI